MPLAWLYLDHVEIAVAVPVLWIIKPSEVKSCQQECVISSKSWGWDHFSKHFSAKTKQKVWEMCEAEDSTFTKTCSQPVSCCKFCRNTILIQSIHQQMLSIHEHQTWCLHTYNTCLQSGWTWNISACQRCSPSQSCAFLVCGQFIKCTFSTSVLLLL